MKANSNSLERDALTWAMCRALGHSPVIAEAGIAYRNDHDCWVYPRYTDDSEAGPLMSVEWVGVERPSKGQTIPLWRAVTDSKIPPKPHEFQGVVAASGETLGIAVCRAIVLSRCGKVVDIPDQLLVLESGN